MAGHAALVRAEVGATALAIEGDEVLIGAMNHPAFPVTDEIESIAAAGMDFVDLRWSLPRQLPGTSIRRRFAVYWSRHKMAVVGHTAYYLPMASAIEELRRASVCELRRCMEAFSIIGARWMNVHADRHTPMHDRSFYIEQNLRSFEELMADTRRLGVGLMIENLPGDYNSASQLGELLDRCPNSDCTSISGTPICRFPTIPPRRFWRSTPRGLRHVHLHDNKGGSADLHLPLGAGNIDLPRMVRALKRSGYDGTITLEVFTPDKHYLSYSRDKLRRIWDETAV